jgi:LysM repeat protein
MRRILALARGLAALLTLVALTVGLPWLLVATVGNPYPSAGLMLTGRLTDSALIGVVAAVAWVVWAQLVVCVVVEVIAELRLAVGKSAAWLTRVPGTFDAQQQFARSLVQAVAAAVLGAGVTASPVIGVSTSTAVEATAVTAEEIKPVNSSPPQASMAAVGRSAEPHEVKVAKGDTLWSLAERNLGSGERWREIAELNAGRRMVDGQAFSHAGTIRPGWRLLVPVDQVPVVAGVANVQVESGDTLWGIAEEEYGEGQRWPRVYAANRDQITDPDVIHPGQVLDLPGRRSERQTPVTEIGREPSPSVDIRTPIDRVPPKVVDGDDVAASETPLVAESEGHTADEPVNHGGGGSHLAALLSGGGSLLGAGLLGLLVVRRRMQYRNRRSGRVVSRTPADLVPVETAVRGAADGQDDAEFLDQSLRELVDGIRERDGVTTLPDVAAVRLSEDRVELRLVTPSAVRVPEPWSENDAGDVLTRSREVPVDESDSLPPYPALVTVGTDESGARWLLDLEAAGTIRLCGEPDLAADVARFAVAELGVNTWSDGVVLRVDDLASALIGLDPERIRRTGDGLADELVRAAHDVMDSSHVTGLDVLTGRLDGRAAEAWMPTVAVVSDARFTEHDLAGVEQALHSPPGRKAVALLVVGGDDLAGTSSLELTVRHDGWMSIEPLGVKVQANRVTREAAHHIAALVSHHREAEDEPMPPAAGERPYEEVSDAAGALLADVVSERAPDTAAESLMPQPDEEYLSAGATTSEDLAALAPAVPKQVEERILALDPTLDDDLAAWHDPETSRPRIGVLGPVELLVVEEPTGDARNRRAYAAEVVVYLTTHPQGTTTEQLACAFDVKENVVHNYVTAARKWVGTDPTTGTSYIPDCTKTEAARKRGMGVYQVVGILSDEDLFRRLRVRAQARGHEGIDDLVAALRLVRGRPFDQIRKRGYGWLAETPIDHQFTAAIVDVAHIVATDSLARGDVEAARWAAETAILAAPAEEKPKLDLAAVMKAMGEDDKADAFLEREIYERSDDGGVPADLGPRSSQVLTRRNGVPTDH